MKTLLRKVSICHKGTMSQSFTKYILLIMNALCFLVSLSLCGRFLFLTFRSRLNYFYFDTFEKSACFYPAPWREQPDFSPGSLKCSGKTGEKSNTKLIFQNRTNCLELKTDIVFFQCVGVFFLSVKGKKVKGALFVGWQTVAPCFYLISLFFIFG